MSKNRFILIKVVGIYPQVGFIFYIENYNKQVKYSTKLIQETITVFKEEDGLHLSFDEASKYLNALGGLFLAFTPIGVVRLAPKGQAENDDTI